MKILIGKIVNTHGLKGELRILSEFKYKKEAIIKNQNILIDNEEYKITSTRPHKQFEMIFIEGFNNINDVLKFKGKNVYVNRENLKINGVIKEDIIGFVVKEKEKTIGKVTDLLNNHQELLVIDNDKLIPFVDNFIKKVDKENETIEVELIEGLIDEN